jgi:hypothetical protein
MMANTSINFSENIIIKPGIIENGEIKNEIKNEIKKEKDYRVCDLKLLCKKHGIKCSGRKRDIYDRLSKHLKETAAVIKLQRFCSRILYKTFIDLHGPAYYNRKLCSNLEDMVTLDNLEDVPYNYFFSFTDKTTTKIYGFHLVSLYNFIIRSNNAIITNPYTRQNIPTTVITDLIKLLKYTAFFNINLNLAVPTELMTHKTVDERVNALFYNINELGNYASPGWFLELTTSRLITFYKELYDIWIYRANLDNFTRATICPPTGNVFANTSVNTILQSTGKEQILTIMEKLVNSSPDNANRSLGAIYILTALTIVSPEAAAALPWLHAIV